MKLASWGLWRRSLPLVLSVSLGWPTLAVAEGPPEDLPPAERVAEVLDQHPAVLAAQGRLRAARAEHDRLKAGEYEYEVSVMGQHRRVDAGTDFNEWEIGMDRGLRLPGKARLDDRIGLHGVHEAEELVGDARHELAKGLLTLWYDALRMTVERDLWQRQAALLGEQRRVTEIRVKRGDAAQLELLQTDAALAQAQSEAGRAAGEWRRVHTELLARFPGLPEPRLVAAEPTLPAGGEAVWVAHVMAHNHELQAVQQASERARLQASRAAADRLSDPRLGLFYANESDGMEKVMGVRMAIALPGQARQAQQAMLLGQAQAAEAAVEVTQRRLRAEAAANWQRAETAVNGAGQLKAAADAMARHATLTRRAYELGELGLTETLLAQRASLDAQLLSEQALLNAREAIARLLLDAHQLWAMPERDEQADEHHK